MIMAAFIFLMIAATGIILLIPGQAAMFKVNPAFKKYITAYTSGAISTEGTIRVELAYDMADSSMFGVRLQEQYFEFSPGIEGEAVWVDTRTLEFRPSAPLKPNTLYSAEFFISKLMDMPDSLSVFRFQFRTRKQALELTVNGRKAADPANLMWEQISGTLITADVADPDQIQKLITARQDGRRLPVSVQADASRMKFSFTVDSVRRAAAAGTVEITAIGGLIGADETPRTTLKIPAISEFAVTDVKVIQSPEQAVLVEFSDPLSADQELEGLIQLGDLSNLRYLVEDNTLRIFLAEENFGEHTLVLSGSLKNTAGKSLGRDFRQELTFENLKPDVRLIGQGTILPSSNGLIFPFEAVNLRAVDVKILKIYQQNVAQFLQVNSLDGDNELSRVGKVVLRKTLQLSSATNAPVNYNRWNRFSLDLAELIQSEPGAIYRISITFRKEYSLYDCGDTTAAPADENALFNREGNRSVEDEDWDYYSDYNYYYDDEDGYYYYDWSERDNPCSDSYYNYKTYSRNILASDIGLIVKGGQGGLINVYTANIVTAEPMPDVALTFYDYQHQMVGKAVTNGEGMCSVQLKQTPFLLMASKDKQKAWLRLTTGSALSMSMFDVDGSAVRKGIKGFIYGERGVWRPGDSIYLTFVLEDKLKRLPPEIPVSMTLSNPRGQKIKHLVRTKGLNGFYDFRTATDPSAITGDYTATVKVGGAVFTKTIKVETIKPNRLKIVLDFPGTRIMAGQQSDGQLEARWLHGAIARNLRATVSMRLKPAGTVFEKFRRFTFDDPAREFRAEEQLVFDGKLDANGRAVVKAEFETGTEAPGVLRAYFETRVFEEGGDFSVDRFSIPYYPYPSYVGVDIPNGKDFDFVLSTGTPHTIRVANVNANGQPLVNSNVKVDVYKIDWRWWWDNSGNDVASYVRSNYNVPVHSYNLTTVNGLASFSLNVEAEDWGRYYIRVTDLASGHTCGEVVYVDWPDWSSHHEGGSEAASMLLFTSDKESYKVGETVILSIPSSEGSCALVTIENGSRVLQSAWVKTSSPQTIYRFTLTEEMSPNVYAHVSLLQPHAQVKNDLPVRLYGVIPILAENPGTHITPVIAMLEVLRPDENASITVREQSGKAMTYTLAVVDEGLLDLTKFKTPDPWNYFYAREALGVRTWDVYDDVIGAYGGELERLLSLGGGDDGQSNPGKNRANRFKPMVKFYGPFVLGKGQSKTYTFKMPQYIGSVRVMVVAGQDGAYGSAEKTVQVKKPLMLLATMPRVVGPGESVAVPVSVFATEKFIRTVNVNIIPNAFLSLEGSATQTVTFSEPGDQLVSFRLKVKSGTGVGRVKVVASCGKETAVHEIEIDVRNPNPEITQVVEAILKPGASWNPAYTPVGLPGTNRAVVEFSSIPPINLEKRLKYLVSYPYGCVEQTTSSVFPQLYLSDLMELDASYKARVEKNIRAGIARIASLQAPGGGFAYWPGGLYADDWGSSYAGHFLLEAKAKGYAVNESVLRNWKQYQRKRALAWTTDNSQNFYNSDLVQAYRLYTLALARAPELGAMNRLREKKDLSVAARWRLAAAYHLAGHAQVASAMVSSVTYVVPGYRDLGYSYGSAERDQAMMIETLVLMGQKMRAAPLIKMLSAKMAANKWMSTQTTAYCLLAISKFAATGSGTGISVEYRHNDGAVVKKQSSKSVMIADLGLKGSAKKGKLSVKNNGKGLLYARIIMQGIPAAGQEKSAEANLKLLVSFTDTRGNRIDVRKLAQGTDFVAEINVGNPGLLGHYSNLALSTIFPSGWEIHNTRMDDYMGRISMSAYDYIDYRDDRVYTFFGLAPNKMNTYRFLLNAAYLGRFYLPAFLCEAMYDQTIYARSQGMWVEVVPYASTETAQQ